MRDHTCSTGSFARKHDNSRKYYWIKFNFFLNKYSGFTRDRFFKMGLDSAGLHWGNCGLFSLIQYCVIRPYNYCILWIRPDVEGRLLLASTIAHALDINPHTRIHACVSKPALLCCWKAARDGANPNRSVNVRRMLLEATYENNLIKTSY